MSEGDIKVRFGASIEGLTASLDTAGEQLAELTAPIGSCSWLERV
jgi:hypothetical protein